MKKNKFSIKTIRVLLFCIGLGIVFIFLFGAVASFNKYQKQAREYKKRQSYLVNLKTDADSLKKLLERYQQEKERFKALLFSERDIPSFLDEISKFANDSKVNIVSVTTRSFVRVKYAEIEEASSTMAKNKLYKNKDEEEKGPMLTYLPIQMTIQGRFEAIVDFLIYVEKYRQLLTLSDVEIGLRDYPVLECKFTINIYSLQEAEEFLKKK